MVGLYLNLFLIFSRHHGFPSRGFFNFEDGREIGSVWRYSFSPFRNLHIFVQRRSSHYSSVQSCRQTRILTPADPIISPKNGREKAGKSERNDTTWWFLPDSVEDYGDNSSSSTRLTRGNASFVHWVVTSSGRLVPITWLITKRCYEVRSLYERKKELK
jgi:hypothetical protein